MADFADPKPLWFYDIVERCRQYRKAAEALRTFNQMPRPKENREEFERLRDEALRVFDYWRNRPLDPPAIEEMHIPPGGPWFDGVKMSVPSSDYEAVADVVINQWTEELQKRLLDLLCTHLNKRIR